MLTPAVMVRALLGQVDRDFHKGAGYAEKSHRTIKTATDPKDHDAGCDLRHRPQRQQGDRVTEVTADQKLGLSRIGRTRHGIMHLRNQCILGARRKVIRTRSYIKPIRQGLHPLSSAAKAESRRRRWPARSTRVKTCEED
jgi:hypothetical protein